MTKREFLDKLKKDSKLSVQAGNLGCVSLFKENELYIDTFVFGSERDNIRDL